MLHALYLLGVAAFAASGVLAAHRANMDPFGGLVLAFAAGISGGTLRDLILDRHPLYWTHDWVLLVLIASVGVTTMLYLRRQELPHRTLMVADALGLAVVTVIGARAAIDAHVTPVAVLILAVLTGVTGEVVRDVLCGEFLRCCCARRCTRPPRWRAPPPTSACSGPGPRTRWTSSSRPVSSSRSGWRRSSATCTCPLQRAAA